ncbi:hypothetical protein QQZ08_006339 [Neonectria magnoliae]|uniref:Uncharacterized protein n=1 Tax=Neonectria magnoliae TaxID=2732573 RepID=A0ABR1I1A4_9HYPO
MAALKRLCWALLTVPAFGTIDRSIPIKLLLMQYLIKLLRKRIVNENNIIRTSLIDNKTTPLQVGNGNFAFSVDTTGMQSYLAFNTLSSWAWHNDTLPSEESIDSYTGIPRETHGRNVSYDIPNPNLPAVSQWLISNPNRINLGRIGLRYKGRTLSVDYLSNTHQELDLWNGIITSTFTIDGTKVKVVTQGDLSSDAVTFEIKSELIDSGLLEVELDFPYPPFTLRNTSTRSSLVFMTFLATIPPR